MNSNTLMIDARGLTRRFVTRAGVVEAVRGVDLHVSQGSIVGLLGPNGAGKSTTMRMLTTLLLPDAGEAVVAGHDLRRAPGRVRERIGYVSQTGGAEGTATARENIILQCRLYGATRASAYDRARELLAALDLDAVGHRPAATYSGGQRRRLDLALGLAHRPALLFLDEPTSGLDPQSRARLWDEVRRLRETGTTMVLTTHYLDEADALCDHLVIIDHGRVVAEGAPDALKRQVAGDVVTLDLRVPDETVIALLRSQPFVRELQHEGEQIRLYVDQGGAALPALIRLLDSASIEVHALGLARPTLDDVFLRQTGRTLREPVLREGGVSHGAAA